jgi:hypothetical protein
MLLSMRAGARGHFGETNPTRMRLCSERKINLRL